MLRQGLELGELWVRALRCYNCAMQLGLTIPLQKFLKLPKPPYGEASDLFFCWELHKIPHINRSTFIAVNASNRYALIFAPMQAHDWKRLPQIVAAGIGQSLLMEGYSADQVEAYLSIAGQAHFTKTHGRKPVAGLNRAIEYFYHLDKFLDEGQLFQPAMSAELNADLCNAAGFPGRGYGRPREFLIEDMGRFGIGLNS